MAINHEIFRFGEVVANDRLIVSVNCVNERFSAVLIQPMQDTIHFVSVESAVASAEAVLRNDPSLGTLAIYDPNHFFADEGFDDDEGDAEITAYSVFNSASP